MKRSIGILGLLATATACAPPAPPASSAPTAKPTASATVAPGGGGNVGGLISNDAGGLVSNNAGGLKGTFRVPRAGLVATHAPTLLAGGFKELLAASPAPGGDDGLVAAPAGARVTLIEVTGDMLTPWVREPGSRVDPEDQPVTLDATGSYTFTRLEPSGPFVVARTTFRLEGHEVTVEALVRAPRTAGLHAADADPATTLVSRKLRAQIAARAIWPANLRDDATILEDLAGAVGRAAGDGGLVAGILLPEAEAVKAYDLLVANRPALRAEVGAAAAAMLGLAP